MRIRTNITDDRLVFGERAECNFDCHTFLVKLARWLNHEVSTIRFFSKSDLTFLLLGI